MSRKSGYSGVWIAEEKLSLSDVVDMNKNVFDTKLIQQCCYRFKNDAKANGKIRGLSDVCWVGFILTLPLLQLLLKKILGLLLRLWLRPL